MVTKTGWKKTVLVHVFTTFIAKRMVVNGIPSEFDMR
jgi:hypothetical protein